MIFTHHQERHHMTTELTVDEKRTYWVWAGMIARCNNPKHASFKNYGGRGITVCAEWRDSKTFLADMGPRPPGTTIDRRDNDRGYCKENCYWADRKIQSLNKRMYKNNKTGVSGVYRSKFNSFNIAVRREGKMILQATVRDFFEACCLVMSAKAKFDSIGESDVRP